MRLPKNVICYVFRFLMFVLQFSQPLFRTVPRKGDKEGFFLILAKDGGALSGRNIGNGRSLTSKTPPLCTSLPLIEDGANFFYKSSLFVQKKVEKYPSPGTACLVVWNMITKSNKNISDSLFFSLPNNHLYALSVDPNQN